MTLGRLTLIALAVLVVVLPAGADTIQPFKFVTVPPQGVGNLANFQFGGLELVQVGIAKKNSSPPYFSGLGLQPGGPFFGSLDYSIFSPFEWDLSFAGPQFHLTNVTLGTNINLAPIGQTTTSIYKFMVNSSIGGTSYAQDFTLTFTGTAPVPNPPSGVTTTALTDPGAQFVDLANGFVKLDPNLFANVSFTLDASPLTSIPSPIPEPATLLLLGSASAVLWGFRRRRR